MGNCKKCGVGIDDKYNYCLKCMDEYKKGEGSQTKNKTQINQENNMDIIELLKQISKHLEHMNWNLGLISQTLVDKPGVVKKIQDEIKKSLNTSKSKKK